MAVVLDPYQSALSFQVFNYLCSCLVSVHSGVCRIIVNDSSIVVHNVDNRQVVAQTNFKVVRVVSRSYLNNACTEVHFYIVISNDGYLSVNDRQDNCLADKILVALVLGVNCNCCIAQECLRTCGSQFQVVVSILDLVSQMPEMSSLILISYFCVRK